MTTGEKQAPTPASTADESVEALAASVGVLSFGTLEPRTSTEDSSDADRQAEGAPEPTAPRRIASPDESADEHRLAGIPAVTPTRLREQTPPWSPRLVSAPMTIEVGTRPDDDADEVDWTWPAPPESEVLTEEPYSGRCRVGEPGSMTRVKPSTRIKLAGPHRPDSVVDAGEVSAALALGAVSVKGASHHHTGIPRQDAYAFGIEGDWLVAAIGDGVSEGHMSHLAADRAVNVAVSETKKALALRQNPQSIDWARISQLTREAVRALGVQMALGSSTRPTGVTVSQPSDRAIARKLATTCDILIARTSNDPHTGLAVTRVQVSGDGSFYILDPERGWGLLGIGKDTDGAQIDNSVVPLPMDPGEPTVTHWDLLPGQAAIVCTDGFGDVIGRGALPVGRYLFAEWQRPIDTTRLLRTSSFINMNADDDRTAVILWAAS